MKLAEPCLHDQPTLRALAEATLAHGPEHSAADQLASQLDTKRMLHELHVYQIELEMQNEALREAQGQLAISRDRYADLYEHAPVGYFTLNVDGLIGQINLAATVLLGMERRHLLSRNFNSLVTPQDQLRWRQQFADMKNQGGKGRLELSLWRNDDTVLHAQLDWVVQRDDKGAMAIWVALTDITARRQAETELRIAAVAFSSENGIMITDSSHVILRVNPAFTKLTGYSAEDVVGKTPAILRSGRQDAAFYQKMWDELRVNGFWQGEVWDKRKNGDVYPELLTITAVYSADNELTHYVGSFADISESKAAAAEIHRLAYYDVLTKLPNRRLLQDRLDQAIATAARSQQYGAVFFIDLDHFKQLNDSRGHDVGDLLLTAVSQRLLDAVRLNDTVARQGGDEFVILMSELGDTAEGAAQQASQLGEKLRISLAEPFDLNGVEYYCKTSIGVSLFQGHDTAITLLKHADLALYQAKDKGRDRLQFFDPRMQAELEQRGLMEADLRLAVPLGQLRLYYQSQVNAARVVVGVEALLRWEHPHYGLLQPDDFIPLAEDTGLILPLGRWVLDAACAQLKAWERDPHKRHLQLAVNVSARQFRQPDFVAQIRAVLQGYGINPTRLKLELTESMVLEDVADAIKKMQAVKQMGVQFSMDDFGIGYSSLSYLAQLPLDQIKIDKSFVCNLPGVAKDETIARAIINMGLGLNLNVIAEGVETEFQCQFLAAHGCQAYQGFLFGHPVPGNTLSNT